MENVHVIVSFFLSEDIYLSIYLYILYVYLWLWRMIWIISNKYFILKLLLVAWTDFRVILKIRQVKLCNHLLRFHMNCIFFSLNLHWQNCLKMLFLSCRLLPDPAKLSHRLFLKDHLSEIFQTLPSKEFWSVDRPRTFILSEHYKMSSVWCPKFSINVCFSFFIKSVIVPDLWIINLF